MTETALKRSGALLTQTVLETVCRFCGHNFFRQLIPRGDDSAVEELSSSLISRTMFFKFHAVTSCSSRLSKLKKNCFGSIFTLPVSSLYVNSPRLLLSLRLSFSLRPKLAEIPGSHAKRRNRKSIPGGPGEPRGQRVAPRASYPG